MSHNHYFKFSLRALVSRFASYAEPEWTTQSWEDVEDSNLTHHYFGNVLATTGGETITVSNFATITLAIFQNDGTQDVTLTWTDNNADANSIVIPAGMPFVCPDVDPTAANFVLTAASGSQIIHFAFVGT